MDTGSSQSFVDGNEAKPKASAASSSLPTPQIQPPITVMMQQAIAMQQFQFQQALLMQQVMASQQAAARAATVKSAAEMAAARAAEISKQLKGADVGEAIERTIDRRTSRSKSLSGSRSRSHSGSQLPSRSVSRSPSKSSSKSRSKSRSRIRSPVRYRRDRSLSGSPVRYRRDRFSPPRYRNYHRYQSHSRSMYRGYHRGGYEDYSWSYHRREWDRDRFRDHHSHVRRSRSRSRSISRVRRRSRTRSQSRNYGRDRSISPRHHRKDRSAGHLTRKSRSRSKEAKHSLSGRSLSASKESGSMRRQSKGEKSSLTPELKVGDDSDHQEAHDTSVDNEASLHQKSSPCSSKAERKEDVNSIECTSEQDSPVRSFSVSLEQSSQKDQKENSEDDGISARQRNTSSHKHENDDAASEADETQLSMEEEVAERSRLQLSTANSDGLTMAMTGHNRGRTSLSSSKDSDKEPDGWSRKIKRKEVAGDFDSSEAEMDNGEELDDWRDDIKAYERERALRKESRKEAAKKEDLVDEGFSLDSRGHSLRPYTESSLEEINGDGQEKGQIAPDCIQRSQDVLCEGTPDNFRDRDIRHQFDPLLKSKHPVESVAKTDLDKDEYVDYKSDADTRDTKSCEASDEGREADLIFEGPFIPEDEFLCNQQEKNPLKHDIGKNVIDSEYSSDRFCDDELTRSHRTSHVRGTHKKKSRHRKGIADASIHHKRKGRERYAQKGDLESDDGEEWEKHRDRLKKHRRKHGREKSAELDDDDRSVDGGILTGKKRHKRRHKKDDEGRKEKKKRRHKHRVKDSSCSHNQFLSPDSKNRFEGETAIVYRKSSRRHKRRRKGASELSPLSLG